MFTILIQCQAKFVMRLKRKTETCPETSKNVFSLRDVTGIMRCLYKRRADDNYSTVDLLMVPGDQAEQLRPVLADERALGGKAQTSLSWTPCQSNGMPSPSDRKGATFTI